MTDIPGAAASGLLSAPAADLCARAFDAARAGWAGFGVKGADPRWLYVPGRIEVLGKHTDYAGGSTLTCAAERGVCAVYSPRHDNVVRILDMVDRRTAVFAMIPDLVIPIGDWSNYPMTVGRRLARNFEGPLRGMDVAFRNTLPVSAGMSSSSALMTTVFLALAGVNALDDRAPYRAHVHSRTDLASYLGSVENGQALGVLTGDHGVGTFGGSEDHTAILCSEQGRIGHFEFCPGRRLASLPVPTGCTFIVASSGIVAKKTGNARERYNRASLLVGEILRLWRDATGRADLTLRAAVHSAGDAADRLRSILAERPSPAFSSADLVRRLEHFLLENETLVPQAARALAEGDADGFGRAARASQRAAEELLQSQVPETIALARSAEELGALATSAFGGGFGGSVWALVRSSDAQTFAASWRARYRTNASPRIFGRAVFFETAAGPPAMQDGVSDAV
jgi:galactokinase